MVALFEPDRVTFVDPDSKLFAEMIRCIFEIAVKHRGLYPNLENLELDDVAPESKSQLGHPIDDSTITCNQSNKDILNPQLRNMGPLIAILQINPNSRFNIKLCQLLCSKDAEAYKSLIINFDRSSLSAMEQFNLLHLIMFGEMTVEVAMDKFIYLLNTQQLLAIFKVYIVKKEYAQAVSMLRNDYEQLPPRMLGFRYSAAAQLFFPTLSKLSMDDVLRMQLVQSNYFTFWVNIGVPLIDDAFKRGDTDMVKCLTQAHTAERLSSAFQATPPKQYAFYFSNHVFLKWYINAELQQVELFDKVFKNPKNASSFRDLVASNKLTVELMGEILKWPLAPVEEYPDSSSHLQFKSK